MSHQPYTATKLETGEVKLVHHAFGKDTIFHSKQAAHAHAQASGHKEATFAGDPELLDAVADQTDSEANPEAFGLGRAGPAPNPNAGHKKAKK